MLKGDGSILNKAIEIANKVHTGQIDKGGESYILHPLRVMLTRENDVERICAVLHDTIEDSSITLDELRKEGFEENVIEILDCLTKRKNEEYIDFINRILKNVTACKIKLADIQDNMNLSRIKNPTMEDKERINKYKSAEILILKELEKFQ